MNLDISTIKRIARQQRLERERMVGRPRAKSFGGKPDARQDRKAWKRQARDAS